MEAQGPPPGPPSPQAGQPAGYPPPGAGQPQNGMAIAALVCGIVGAILAIFFWPVGIILSILGVIFGIIGRNRANNFPPQTARRGMATAGLVLGIVGVLISLGWIIFTVLLVSEVANNPEQFNFETTIR